MAAEADDPDLDTRTLDAVFEEVARLDSRFGGFYVEGGTPTIVLTDSSRSTEVVNAARDRFARHTVARTVRVRIAEYPFSTLSGWRRAIYARPLPAAVTAVDVDERENRLRIAIEAGTDSSTVVAFLADAAVPRTGVMIEYLPRPARAESTLAHFIRPTMGAQQIAGTYRGCTLGFNAKKPGDTGRYFVTNAHCSLAIGILDGASFGQPLLGGQYQLGTEWVDPPFSPYLPNCPAGVPQGCRYADGMLVKYDPAVSVGLHRLAQTTYAYWGADPNQGGSTILAPALWFLINAELPNTALVYGVDVNKIGATSGWTAGFIQQTCVDYIFPTYALLCQWQVAAVSRSGDSGSPVFRYDTGIPGAGAFAQLAGILWGASAYSDGTPYFIFSSIAGIEGDLGPLNTVKPVH